MAESTPNNDHIERPTEEAEPPAVAAARIAAQGQVAAARLQVGGVRTQAAVLVMTTVLSSSLTWVLKPTATERLPTEPSPPASPVASPASNTRLGDDLKLTVLKGDDAIYGSAGLAPYFAYLQMDCTDGTVVVARSAQIAVGAPSFKGSLNAAPYQVRGYILLFAPAVGGFAQVHQQGPATQANFDVPSVSSTFHLAAVLCVTSTALTHEPYPSTFPLKVVP